MALSNGLVRSNNIFLKMIYYSSRFGTKVLFKNVHQSGSEFDAMDAFTTQLVQTKLDKWETLRIRRQLPKSNVTTVNNNEETENSMLDIRDYSKEKLNQLLYENLKSPDSRKAVILIDQCVKYRTCPSTLELQKMFSFCAQKGDRETVVSLQNLVKDHDADLYNLNAQFTHYLAEATWVKGNISESLKLFKDVYTNYSFLRRKIRLMLKYMIANVTSGRSEAALVLITNFAENLAKNYVDFFPLVCIWQCCFVSEWYADQMRASELLERHEELCSLITNRIPSVVQTALKNHQAEVVYRLFELLLKCKMRTHYSYVLQSLFNYKFLQNDFRSCAEILQWSININVPLNNEQHGQFITLLLNHDTTNSSSFKKPPSPPSFKLKF